MGRIIAEMSSLVYFDPLFLEAEKSLWAMGEEK